MYEKIEYRTMSKVVLIGLIFFFLSLSSSFAQWEPDVRLTFDDSTSSLPRNSQWVVAADGNTIHVVWYDNRDGNYEIYYKRSIERKEEK